MLEQVSDVSFSCQCDGSLDCEGIAQYFLVKIFGRPCPECRLSKVPRGLFSLSNVFRLRSSRTDVNYRNLVRVLFRAVGPIVLQVRHFGIFESLSCEMLPSLR